jgi:hypothetical protein
MALEHRCLVPACACICMCMFRRKFPAPAWCGLISIDPGPKVGDEHGVRARQGSEKPKNVFNNYLGTKKLHNRVKKFKVSGADRN